MSDAEIADIAAWCKAQASKGADTLHAKATTNETRAPKLTDAESAAIARTRIDQGRTP